MYTTFDKALVALIMAVLNILQSVFHISVGISPDTLTVIIAALTPVLVWLFPNKIPKG